MSEREFQQAFVEKFKAAAPGYPQPVRDYRAVPEQLLTFDLAWPEQKVAVEVGSKPSVIHLTDWKVFSLSPYGKAHLSDVIEEVKRALHGNPTVTMDSITVDP